MNLPFAVFPKAMNLLCQLPYGGLFQRPGPWSILQDWSTSVPLTPYQWVVWCLNWVWWSLNFIRGHQFTSFTWISWAKIYYSVITNKGKTFHWSWFSDPGIVLLLIEGGRKLFSFSFLFFFEKQWVNSFFLLGNSFLFFWYSFRN